MTVLSANWTKADTSIISISKEGRKIPLLKEEGWLRRQTLEQAETGRHSAALFSIGVTGLGKTPQLDPRVGLLHCPASLLEASPSRALHGATPPLRTEVLLIG
jgi:hypothetical protein